jgi:hypothetical protein
MITAVMITAVIGAARGGVARGGDVASIVLSDGPVPLVQDGARGQSLRIRGRRRHLSLLAGQWD